MATVKNPTDWKSWKDKRIEISIHNYADIDILEYLQGIWLITSSSNLIVNLFSSKFSLLD
jgi:hypothetical protein